MSAVIGIGAVALGDTVELLPANDNTLVETEDGGLSLALSEFVFAGRVGNHGGNAKLRRGLLRFDVVAALPAGAQVESVELRLFCVMTNSGPHAVGLHRLLASWGEGSSFGAGGAGAPATRGDATWLHRFWPDTFWATPGGDFAPRPSAEIEVGVPGPYVWTSTPGMVEDVQGWLERPESNHGWLVRGDEPFVQSVKAFASRENTVLKQRPVLVVSYRPAARQPCDLDGDGSVNASDLALLLGAWGRCGTERCDADLTTDGTVDEADLQMLFDAWSGA